MARVVPAGLLTRAFADDELFSGAWADQSHRGRLPELGRRARRPEVPRCRPAQLGGVAAGAGALGELSTIGHVSANGELRCPVWPPP